MSKDNLSLTGHAARPSVAKPLTLPAIAVTSSLLILLALIGSVHYSQLVVDDGVIIAGLALVMANTSIVGIWWARSAWPSHAKTLLAVCAGAILWCLLIALSDLAEFRTAIGAAWAVSLTVQLVVSGILALLVESLATKRQSHRFSLLFLFVWTSLVAVLLGVGRRLAESMNWTAADVVGWEFFLELQFVAIVNAFFAAALLVSLRLPASWRLRMAAQYIVAAAFSLLTPVVMELAFPNPGGTYVELFFMMVVQSLVLLAVLIPLEARTNSRLQLNLKD